MTVLQHCYWKYINILHKTNNRNGIKQELLPTYIWDTGKQLDIKLPWDSIIPMFKSKLIMEKETARGKNMLATSFIRKHRWAYLQQPGTAFMPGFLQQTPAAHVSLLTMRYSLIHCPVVLHPIAGSPPLGTDVGHFHTKTACTTRYVRHPSGWEDLAGQVYPWKVSEGMSLYLTCRHPYKFKLSCRSFQDSPGLTSTPCAYRRFCWDPEWQDWLSEGQLVYTQYPLSHSHNSLMSFWN